MNFWNENKARAVVPSENLIRSRDVIEATEEITSQSKYPFGIGVLVKNEMYRTRAPLRLFYVSEAVVEDRLSRQNKFLSRGINAGWYAVSEPLELFEVRITMVRNWFDESEEEEDCITTSLTVDGSPTNSSWLFFKGGKGKEILECGYVEKCIETAYRRVMVEKVHPFMFKKSETIPENRDRESEGDEHVREGQGVGEIVLSLEVGVSCNRATLPLLTDTQNTFDLESKRIHEGVREKEGKTLSVEREQYPIVKNFAVSQYDVDDERELPEATVRVYFREAIWMQSRALLDAQDSPCTLETFKRMIAERNASMRPQKLPKRFRSQSIRLNSNVFAKGEVIDLTQD